MPVNPNNLEPRRLGDIMVSLAGPMSNLALAAVCGLTLRAMLVWESQPVENTVLRYVYFVLFMTMLANIGLCVFNLIPLFPLDGHHIARESLPSTESRMRFMQWQRRYGGVVLLVIVFVPRLASVVLKRDVFDPVGWLFTHAARAAIELLDLWPVAGVVRYIWQ